MLMLGDVVVCVVLSFTSVAPTMSLTLEGSFETVDNTSFPDGCIDRYGAQIADKAAGMVAMVNEIISTQLCAHAPNLALRYSDIYVSGQNNKVNIERYVNICI